MVGDRDGDGVPPIRVEEGQTYYALNLDPKANDGLHRVQAKGTQKLFWPEDRRAEEGKKLVWWGWLCTVRNRGMHPLSDINFVTPVSYTYGSDPEPKEWTTHQVNIPMLAPNESLKLLLGSSRNDVYVDVYKPKVMVVRIGNETSWRTLRTRLLPFKDFWDDRASWFLSGPDETTSHWIAEPTRTKPRN